jgi:hypothetical protein
MAFVFEHHFEIGFFVSVFFGFFLSFFLSLLPMIQLPSALPQIDSYTKDGCSPFPVLVSTRHNATRVSFFSTPGGRGLCSQSRAGTSLRRVTSEAFSSIAYTWRVNDKPTVKRFTQREDLALRPSKAFVTVCAVFLVSGCLSGAFARIDLDASAKTFSPPDGKANVYVTGDEGLFGYQCQVSIDSLALGFIESDSFQLFTANPGQHTVTIRVFDHTAQQVFAAHSGENYFFQVIASRGWNVPTVELRRTTEESGRDFVLKSRRTAGF